jgi:hypothetical protein
MLTKGHQAKNDSLLGVLCYQRHIERKLDVWDSITVRSFTGTTATQSMMSRAGGGVLYTVFVIGCSFYPAIITPFQ